MNDPFLEELCNQAGSAEWGDGVWLILSPEHPHSSSLSRFLLPEARVMPGWPNPVLEHMRNDNTIPQSFVQTVESVAAGVTRPPCNMILFKLVEGGCMRGAACGPVEPQILQRMTPFNIAVDRLPDNWIAICALVTSSQTSFDLVLSCCKLRVCSAVLLPRLTSF